MADGHVKEYRVYEVGGGVLPTHTHIVCSEHAAAILYRPHIAGKELQDRMRKVAGVFVGAMGSVLQGKKASEISEVIFLSGGLYYQLNSGFMAKYKKALPQCFLGIKRQRVEGTEGGFTAVATYENFESLPDNAAIIIGDTIATGATLQKGIYHVLDALEERKYELTNLVVCSLACSVEGAAVLKEVESRIARDYPLAKVHLFAAEELFHLMPDGTDLRFLYPDAVMPDETRKRILENYGEYLGKEMKCAVFDWGTRCKNPIKHYHEFLEFADGMLARKLDAKSKGIIAGMKKETEEALADLEKPL